MKKFKFKQVREVELINPSMEISIRLTDGSIGIFAKSDCSCEGRNSSYSPCPNCSGGEMCEKLSFQQAKDFYGEEGFRIIKEAIQNLLREWEQNEKT